MISMIKWEKILADRAQKRCSRANDHKRKVKRRGLQGICKRERISWLNYKQNDWGGSWNDKNHKNEIRIKQIRYDSFIQWKKVSLKKIKRAWRVWRWISKKIRKLIKRKSWWALSNEEYGGSLKRSNFPKISLRRSWKKSKSRIHWKP
jgi:hypothetical protein